MAITYPLLFPTVGYSIALFTSSTFDLRRQTAQNILGSGAVQSAELGEALWSSSYRTIELNPAQRGQWRAWGLLLKNGGKKFYGFDPDRYWPLAYGPNNIPALRFGGGAFDGTCNLVSFTAFTITLANLPNAYQFVAGDLLSFDLSGLRGLYQVSQDIAASAGGGVTVIVEPNVRGTSPGSPLVGVVNLVGASCTMRIVPNSFKCEVGGYTSPVSFDAVQDLS